LEKIWKEVVMDKLRYHPGISFIFPVALSEAQASVKPFVPLQFVNLIDSRQDFFDGGSVRRKAASYTEQQKTQNKH
jgi:hypothetical protein